MDNAHSRPASLPLAIVDSHGSTTDHPHTSSEPAPTTSLLSDRSSTSRHQRLLQSRNARFPAKKLSITGLSNRLNHLIHANTETESKPGRNQENRLSKRRDTGLTRKELSSSQSSAILDEISNSSGRRSVRKRSNIPIYQDSQERPLLDQSPFASPIVHQEASSEFQSPTSLDHIQDSLGDMRLQEISGNTRKSPLASSLKGQRRKQQIQILQKFDADAYIEHIEQELQQARNDAYSPLSQRPLKEKLQSAIYENERLRRELTQVRDRFDAELKRTVEHKTAAEIDLHRKVRDLQNIIEDKDVIICELQHKREEKRLDTNIIETLKSTIEKLEQEKQNMEDENLNVTKRNEVLTQLLAMSPSKPQSAQIVSPSREKRPGRPLSLVLPRAPCSPSTKYISHAAFTVTSPTLEPLSNSRSPKSVHVTQDGYMSSFPARNQENLAKLDHESYSDALNLAQISSKHHLRQETLHSEISDDSVCDSPTVTSPFGEGKAFIKKRPRRFLRGSTQLKPLLLPSLNSDVGFPSSPPSISSGFVEPNFPSSFGKDDSSSIVQHSTPQAESELCSKLEANKSMYNSASISSLEDPNPMLHENEGVHPGCDQETFQSLTESGDAKLFPHNWKFSNAFDMDPSEYLLDQFSDQQLQLYRKLAPPNYFDNVNSSSVEPNLLYQIDDCTPERNSQMPPPLFSPQRSIERNSSFWDSRLLKQQVGNTFHLYKSRKRREPSSPLDGCYSSPTPKLRCRRPPDLTSRSLPAQKAMLSSKSNAAKDAYDKIQPQRALQRLGIIRSPAEFLTSRCFDALPLPSLSIRTLYGFLSKCTSYIRKLKRDPFSLARIVLANAWHKNWAAMGKMSWWVLGLFVDPSHSHVRRRDIDWKNHGAEDIADKACCVKGDEDNLDLLCSPAGMIPERKDYSQHIEQDPCTQTTTDPEYEPGQKARWGQSILLWGKFSMALMLAVGGAVVQGPAEMLRDIEKLKRKSLEAKQNSKLSGTLVERSQGCERCSSHSMPSMIGSSPRPTSIGLSLANVRSPIFTFRSGIQLMAPVLGDVGQHNDIDRTLRPAYGGRSQIQTVFTSHDENLPLEANSFAGTEPFNLQHPARENSCDYEFLRWPSTPDSLTRELS